MADQPGVDARNAVGVQVGEGNTQIIYAYARSAWTDAPAAPPLVTVSGVVESPYRGLNSFDERDAAFFFGREDTVAALLARVAEVGDPALVMVSGVSGAGKTSVLQAGVLPRIRGDGLAGRPDASTWPSMFITPTSSPMSELAVAFATAADLGPGTLRRSLTTNPTDLRLLARKVTVADQTRSQPSGRPGTRRLLLVVDQFEQLFTQCRDEAERRAFVTALRAAASNPGSGAGRGEPAATVVIGIRADYEARCADYPELADAVEHRFLVRAMTQRQLRMAITEPARMAGGAIDDKVVQALLDELTSSRAGGSPGGPVQSTAGALPLLSHALDQAWRISSNQQTVTLPDYERTGGIDGAIGRSAQHVYESLTPDQQLIAQRVFTRLTITDPDGADTADRVSRQELVEQSADPAGVQTVLDAFAQERLLVFDTDAVQISHETLLTAWPLLRDDWLAQSRADRIIRTRLGTAASEWQRHGHDPAYLYTGSVLEVATAAKTRISADPRQPDLGPIDSEFLTASANAQDRRRRRQQALVAALALLLVAVGASAVFAFHQSQAAATQRDVAISRQLIAESENADTDPTDARFESLTAWRLHPSADAHYAMLSAAARPELAVIPTRKRIVTTVAFSPGGRILATRSLEGTVKLWDVASRRQIGTPIADPDGQGINSFAFGPHGKTLATGTGLNGNGRVRFWNVATRQQMGNLSTGHTGAVTDIAISPNGKILATVGDLSGSVQLWDIAARTVIGKPLGGNTYGPVAFSPNGKTLVSAGSHTVQFWDVATHRSIGRPITGHTGLFVAFSPDGRTLASGDGTAERGRSGTAQYAFRLWSVATHQNVGAPFISQTSIVSVAFNPNGRTLASGSADDTVRLWDVATHRQIGAALTGHTAALDSVTFSPDGKTVASGGNDGTARLWDLTTHRQLGIPLSGHKGAVNSVAFSPHGLAVASGSDDQTVRLWDASTHREIGAPITRHVDYVYSVAFSPDGKTLASGGSGGVVRLWDVRTHRQIGAPLNGYTGAVYSVAFSPDRRILAFISDDAAELGSTVRLWNITTNQQIGAPMDAAVGTVAFSPDGKILATGVDNTDVVLWNVATHRRVGGPLTGHRDDVTSVAFSPNGKILASGSADNTVRLWNIATHHQIGDPLTGPTGGVGSVEFSPDGQTLATGSGDGTVRLWDVATRQQIGAPLIDPSGGVNSVDFNRDGRTLATGADDGSVRFWDVHDLTDPASFLCQTAGQAFTQKEWHKVVPPGPRYRAICP